MTLLREYCRYFRRSHSFLEADSTSLPNSKFLNISHFPLPCCQVFRNREKKSLFFILKAFNSFCQETSVDF